MGNVGAQYFAQPGYGPNARVSRDDYNLVSGQEDPRTGRRGHTLHLNIAERARDLDRYFLYHELFARLRAGGSVSGYAHVGSDWFGERSGSHSMCRSASSTWWRSFRRIDFASTPGTTF